MEFITRLVDTDIPSGSFLVVARAARHDDPALQPGFPGGSISIFRLSRSARPVQVGHGIVEVEIHYSGLLEATIEPELWTDEMRATNPRIRSIGLGMAYTIEELNVIDLSGTRALVTPEVQEHGSTVLEIVSNRNSPFANEAIIFKSVPTKAQMLSLCIGPLSKIAGVAAMGYFNRQFFHEAFVRLSKLIGTDGTWMIDRFGFSGSRGVVYATPLHRIQVDINRYGNVTRVTIESYTSGKVSVAIFDREYKDSTGKYRAVEVVMASDQTKGKNQHIPDQVRLLDVNTLVHYMNLTVVVLESQHSLPADAGEWWAAGQMLLTEMSGLDSSTVLLNFEGFFDGKSADEKIRDAVSKLTIVSQ